MYQVNIKNLSGGKYEVSLGEVETWIEDGAEVVDFNVFTVATLCNFAEVAAWVRAQELKFGIKIG